MFLRLLRSIKKAGPLELLQQGPLGLHRFGLMYFGGRFVCGWVGARKPHPKTIHICLWVGGRAQTHPEDNLYLSLGGWARADPPEDNL